MRRLRHLVLLAPLFFLSPPSPGEAQVLWGAHMVHAGKTFNGANGVGIRAGLSVPFLPIDLLATGEHFFTTCLPGFGGCQMQGLALDANLRMMSPVIRPYLTGGIAYRRYDPGGDVGAAETLSGSSVGFGVNLGAGATGVFFEGRYEFVDSPSNQVIWRAGLLMPLF